MSGETAIYLRPGTTIIIFLRRWMLTVAALCGAAIFAWHPVALAVLIGAVIADVYVTPRAPDVRLSAGDMLAAARAGRATGDILDLGPRKAALQSALWLVLGGGAIAALLAPAMFEYARAFNPILFFQSASWGLALGGCAAASWHGANIFLAPSRPIPVLPSAKTTPALDFPYQLLLLALITPRSWRDLLGSLAIATAVLALAQLGFISAQPSTGEAFAAALFALLGSALSIGAWVILWGAAWFMSLVRDLPPAEPIPHPPMGLAAKIALGVLGFAVACVVVVWVFYVGAARTS